MKKPWYSLVLYGIAVLSVVLCAVRLIVDYSHYSIAESAPFSVYVIIRAVQYLVPAAVCAVVGRILEKKNSKKTGEKQDAEN